MFLDTVSNTKQQGAADLLLADNILLSLEKDCDIEKLTLILEGKEEVISADYNGFC